MKGQKDQPFQALCLYLKFHVIPNFSPLTKLFLMPLYDLCSDDCLPLLEYSYFISLFPARNALSCKAGGSAALQALAGGHQVWLGGA